MQSEAALLLAGKRDSHVLGAAELYWVLGGPHLRFYPSHVSRFISQRDRTRLIRLSKLISGFAFGCAARLELSLLRDDVGRNRSRNR